MITIYCFLKAFSNNWGWQHKATIIEQYLKIDSNPWRPKLKLMMYSFFSWETETAVVL